MARRVLLVGLDSADAELIERWADAGHLPTFAALRREGLWARLGTTAEVMHVSAWPTIYTGTTPGRHGLYHAYQVRAGDQRIQRTRADWLAQPPFWQQLDAAGRRCIVLDAFMTAPVPGFGGIQLHEYGTWTWFGEPASTPSALHADVVRRFGRYPAPEHMQVTSVPSDLRAFRDKLLAGVAKKSEMTRWFMREHAWDLLFVTFGEPHGAGHYLWHAEDAAYPSHAKGRTGGMATPVRDVYAAVDRALGELLDAAGDETTVLVASGDGMGPNYSATQHVPTMLGRMGLLHTQAAGTGRPSLTKRLRAMLPLPVRQSITRCLPKKYQHGLATGWMNSGTDWTRTRAFLIPNSNEAYIRVNLTGREPEGIVAPQADYDALLQRIAAEMRAASNPANGELAAERVTLMDEVYPGGERPHLPDLVVSWRNEARVLNDLQAPACGHVHGPAGHETSPFYTGNHRALAFVAARGPTVTAGSTLAGGHILDIPATILALLGVDAPAWYEGRVWTSLLAPQATPVAAIV
ncbi:MAG: alkaline phosphatase family protein [Geminicoccaceae bacterium]